MKGIEKIEIPEAEKNYCNFEAYKVGSIRKGDFAERRFERYKVLGNLL